MRHSLFFFSLPLATLASLSYLTVARAQITPDNSLGAENSVVAPNVEIKGIPSDRIDGGAIRGDNLFHSFQQFNINAGRGAYFSNPGGIANILTRVTGGNVSNIQGVLGVLGNANLFLINPNGIIFGPNARLDVGGSFLGSTANSLIFKNGFEFSATNPQAPPLLTITAPVGLSYRENFKNISNQSRAVNDSGNVVGLTVPEGNSLTLVGGNVSLDNGILFAPGGRVELGGLSVPGTVGINGDGSLSFPVGVQRADVSLTNGAIAYVAGRDTGNIAVNARNLELSGGSRLFSGILSGFGTSEAQAGDIKIDAKGTISLLDNSLITSSVQRTYVGNAGNIDITTGSVVLKNGSQIFGGTFGTGNGGIVKINASDTISLDGQDSSGFYSAIGSYVEFNAKGNAGSVQITTKDLTLGNGSFISASIFGQGNAGSVVINASGSVSVDGGSISSNQQSTGMGDAGDVQLTTTNLTLKNSAFLSARTFGIGNGGVLTVNAKDIISLDNSFITSSVQPTGVSNAGGIDITTGSLVLKNGSQILSSTFGQGNGGIVKINASDTISVDGRNSSGTYSAIGSRVERSAKGDAGGIQITTKNLTLGNGNFVSAGTFGQGNAGSVVINANGSVLVDGGDISSGVFSTGEGNAGGVQLTTTNLTLKNEGSLSASINGEGNAGSVLVRASDSVSLVNSYISSTVGAAGVGKGGNINIQAALLSLKDGAQLAASTFGTGDAGNVTVDVTGKVTIAGVKDGFSSGIFNQGGITGVGNGGNITISSGSFSLTDGAQLVTSARGQGNAGNVSVRASGSVELVNGRIFSTVESGGLGKGGNIDISAASLSLKDGAQLLTSVRGASNNQLGGRGDAGNITIQARDAVVFDGVGSNGVPSGASSAVETGAVGNGGNLTVVAGRFNVLNGAEGTVSNLGSGNAGNLEVIANSIKLDNQGKLTANSANGFGGDIILQARDLLLLRRNSLISAISGTPGSDGRDGNININTKLLVAFPQENSDITATGFGRTAGSNVQVNISKPGGIFGIEYQPQQTSESDIVATGTVTVTTIDLDPTQGLFELTETVVDPAQQVAQNPCIKGFGSTFTITGRGGLPTDPNKILSSDNVRVDLIQPVASSVSSTSGTQKQPSQKPPVKQIIPAQGWIYNEKGQVVLVGYDPTKTGPQREQPAPTSSCAATK
ncbi:MAG: filamentous hemagglutinin N-terminal domain-containing protein [Brasilonema octagenarum HA4186-MV1]|nr:filamentous hemagglutinin N-terminal domain-containing protein [Brasilonema octagenarum HA4186-MV1]